MSRDSAGEEEVTPPWWTFDNLDEIGMTPCQCAGALTLAKRRGAVMHPASHSACRALRQRFTSRCGSVESVREPQLGSLWGRSKA
jgi:hypothetical protein